MKKPDISFKEFEKLRVKNGSCCFNRVISVEDGSICVLSMKEDGYYWVKQNKKQLENINMEQIRKGGKVYE